MHNWYQYKNYDQASKAASDFLADRIQQCILEKDCCHVILPGGNTPSRCLGYLAEKPLDWTRVHWYLGDERCYPKGHRERNDEMLKTYFWSSMVNTNIHLIEAELGAELAAEAYQNIIDSVDRLDIAFLGLGEDGHTASLFPGNVALSDPRSVVPVFSSPKPPNERVTLGIDTLRKVDTKIVLAGGDGKREIITRIKAGESLPVNLLGDINWYLYDID